MLQNNLTLFFISNFRRVANVVFFWGGGWSKGVDFPAF